jgi:N-acetylglucosaminyldiphosphoundecaprenol N-acetyl-beta-D-mannosaminyltransferase
MSIKRDRSANASASTRDVDVARVPVRATTFAESVAFVVSRSPSPGAGAIRLVNAWTIVTANDDPSYLAILRGPGLNLPDGKPVAKRIRREVPSAEQVRGPSFFRSVIDEGRSHGSRHYFLGNHSETLDRLKARLDADYPGARIVGMFAPPYLEDPQDLINLCTPAIAATEADFVWVSLGTPKQDFVSASLTASTSAWVVGIGAAFDFVAGTTPESPRWLSRLGGEWLHRLATEPRRLWRRYAIGGFKYLWLVRRR